MAKSTYPPEFPSEWHYTRFLEDTEREIVGRQRRLAELEAMGAHPDQLAQCQMELEAAQAQLAHYGVKPKAKRPRQARETRA